MAAGAFGFWSYVQEDDNGDGGRILDLVGDLRAQYKMRTAEGLELFVDRESIRWGEEWEKLIGDAIAGTTFFIPIITPSYFRSNPCRQELLKFVREADRLGLQQLLMPVYWVTVSELEDDGTESNDEAVRAIARHQWLDLRDVRLEDRASADYRKAVSGLAGEIAARASQVAATVDDLPMIASDTSSEAEGTGDEDGSPGFLELLAQGDEAMEKLTGIMVSFGSDIQLIGDLSNRAQEALEVALAREKGTRAALSITERYARGLQEPAEARREGRTGICGDALAARFRNERKARHTRRARAVHVGADRVSSNRRGISRDL